TRAFSTTNDTPGGRRGRDLPRALACRAVVAGATIGVRDRALLKPLLEPQEPRRLQDLSGTRARAGIALGFKEAALAFFPHLRSHARGPTGSRAMQPSSVAPNRQRFRLARNTSHHKDVARAPVFYTPSIVHELSEPA